VAYDDITQDIAGSQLTPSQRDWTSCGRAELLQGHEVFYDADAAKRLIDVRRVSSRSTKRIQHPA